MSFKKRSKDSRKYDRDILRVYLTRSLWAGYEENCDEMHAIASGLDCSEETLVPAIVVFIMLALSACAALATPAPIVTRTVTAKPAPAKSHSARPKPVHTAGLTVGRALR